VTPAVVGLFDRRQEDFARRIGSTIAAMQVATGTVVDGKIVLEGVPLAEGARVTVVTRGADEGFVLTAAQESALLESLAEIERGQYVSLEELVASLPTHG
jgi:hypothetical protein